MTPSRLRPRLLTRVGEYLPRERTEARGDASRGAGECLNLRMVARRRGSLTRDGGGMRGGVQLEQPVHRARCEQGLPPRRARGDPHGVSLFAVAVAAGGSEMAVG